MLYKIWIWTQPVMIEKVASQAHAGHAHGDLVDRVVDGVRPVVLNQRRASMLVVDAPPRLGVVVIGHLKSRSLPQNTFRGQPDKGPRSLRIHHLNRKCPHLSSGYPFYRAVVLNSEIKDFKFGDCCQALLFSKRYIWYIWQLIGSHCRGGYFTILGEKLPWLPLSP